MIHLIICQDLTFTFLILCVCVCERANLYSMCLSFEVYIVACRIYHTVVLDDPFDDPPGLAGHVPDQSPQLTREQLDVSQPLSHSFCLSESCSGFCYCSTSCVTHTHICSTALFRDYPGEPVPKMYNQPGFY